MGVVAGPEASVAHALEGVAPRPDVERPDRMPPVPLRHGQGLGEKAGVKVVLDTNIVLDLFVFRDEAVAALKTALATREVDWLATPAMREELMCVLAYEQIAARAAAAQ